MAVITENNYISDGVTVLYAVTFDYINETDVKVSYDGAETTAFSFDNATTIRLNASPATGVVIRIFRRTDVEELPATFYPGSTIQASDLNDNFNVSLYVSQEASRDSASAGAALPTAVRAEAKADAAVDTANGASIDAATANNAAADAAGNAAVALSTANSATIKADNAAATADAAAALVATANLPTTVADVPAIPGSPSDNDLIEVTNSTGIESFSPLAGLPGGFVGDAGVAAKLVYATSGGTWNFLEYRPTDPDARYATEADAAAIAQAEVGTLASDVATAQTAANDAQVTAAAALPRSGGTMTGQITFAAGQSFGIGTGDISTAGIVRLLSETNSGLGANDGTAATPYAVREAYNRASTAINTANTANSTATTAQSTATAAQTTANTAQTAANAALPLSGGTLTGELTVPGNTSGNRISFNGGLSGTGFRYNTNGKMQMRCNSLTGIEVDSTGLVNAPNGIEADIVNITGSGTSSSPVLRFDDTNTGLYYAPNTSSGAIRLTKGGDIQWTLAANGLTFNTGDGHIDSINNGQGYYLSGRGRNNDDPSEFRADTSSSSNRVLVVRGNGSSNQRMNFYANGRIEATGYDEFSDARLKTNITDARSQWDDVKALRFVNFEWIGRPGDVQLGWIAQEVQATSPGCVSDTGDHLAVKADVVTKKALKALQEAMIRIEALEARLAELEG